VGCCISCEPLGTQENDHPHQVNQSKPKYFVISDGSRFNDVQL
jgi:hypothetical protein